MRNPTREFQRNICMEAVKAWKEEKATDEQLALLEKVLDTLIQAHKDLGEPEMDHIQLRTWLMHVDFEIRKRKDTAVI